MKERRDIWLAEEADGAWNELVLAYALAFDKLANGPAPGRPQSWGLVYQAAVHDMNPLPPPSDLRATCQHDTWYFLPWHRMYLLHFESVIQAIVAELDDDRISDQTRETWALPYWNYQHPDHRILPKAFRDLTMPDGTQNPLAKAARFAAVQRGTVPLNDDQVEFATWWASTDFTLAGTPSFGGSDTGGRRHRPLAGFPDAGDLENTPHGSVHVYVGPDMRRFDRAGFDPIFWLHHCNLDRLWEVWGHGGGIVRPNPTSGGWTTEAFSFIDVGGALWSRAPQAVESTTALGYSYQDISAPIAPPSPTRSRSVAQFAAGGEEWKRKLAPRALGSAVEPVAVQSTANSTEIELVADEEAFTRSERPAGPVLILEIGNIAISPEDVARVDAGEALIGSYAVYLEGNRAGVEAFAGNLPLFGLRESLDDDGHQLTYSFNVTAAVNLLSDQDAWSWSSVSVRIEPSNHEVFEGEGDIVPIRFGNVTLSYQ